MFCACGQGNVVPWESTTEPEIAVKAELLPPVPELAPMKFAAETSVTLPSRQSIPRDAKEEWPRGLPPPRPRPRQRDPRFCLQHPAVPSQSLCTDCKNGYCGDCLIQLEGKPLCGPCKNERARLLHKPSPMSQLALGSLLLAVVTGPLAFCLHQVGRGFANQELSIWALLPQFAALGLGVWALTRTDKNHRLGGRSLAISAVLTAGFAVFWTVFMTIYATRLLDSYR